VVGASAVISSRALGLTATPPDAPVVTATVGTSNTVLNVSLGAGVATCVPDGSLVATASVVAASYVTVGSPTRATINPPNQTLATPPLALTVTKAAGNSTATVNFRVRYRCTQGTTTQDVCRSWDVTVAAEGNSWGTTGSAFTPTIGAAGTTCP
jgi:hypothetical protein